MAQQFKLTPVPLPVDPPAKKAKKMKNEESRTDAAEMMGDVNMDKESSRTPTLTSVECVKMDLLTYQTWTSLRKPFRSTTGVDPAFLDRQPATHTNDDVAGLPLKGGFSTLQSLANVPKTWPLARLTVPLSGFSKHLERLLVELYR